MKQPPLRVRQVFPVALRRADRRNPRAALGDLFLPEFGRIFENLLALLLHALERSPHGIDTGGKPALQHCHRESNRAAARGIFPCRLDRLVLNIPCELIVEFQFLVVDLERRCLDVSLGE